MWWQCDVTLCSTEDASVLCLCSKAWAACSHSKPLHGASWRKLVTALCPVKHVSTDVWLVTLQHS